MHKQYLLLLAFLISPLLALGQTLKEEKVDEFTKHAIKRTSWESIIQTFKIQVYNRASKIDSLYYLDLKIAMGGPAFSIGKGQEVMLKLANDEIIKLPSPSHEMACRGCGVPGFAGSAGMGVNIAFPLTTEQFDQLCRTPVVKIRVYTTGGYVENEVREKNAEKITKALALVK